ncbi:hypothetical protein P175DRAFT_0532284 [Aspergillus ochraceoroseus IBT 24754]|uniref:Inhibitor I9 domain-containing protein n=3 Tax=Aspergillus subgen. Nidulantes TaxID=2720870 RepID=A0A0F8W7P6_9EURO|nr:uncharacterized protein P175DRAFT_0532284 [Aspergillus ochraceoroseus IBT 24754]KKK13900.1 hypothetical protein ARAM_004217 [Aspergillus rambellii]KKK17935.1 hypothetical protein AOCH_006484 [Aspergillus ochraceoroseus]PTU20920.1 hypothetical protein P175DRAFT_0532284 [Aspergillus ochraceoroseus IBT 24754]
MKLLYTALFLGLLPQVIANSILVTYPKNTPDSVIEEAKESIRKAGGVITHEYSLVIKGFSANAPDAAIQQISTQSGMYKPIIEQDLPVSIS